MNNYEKHFGTVEALLATAADAYQCPIFFTRNTCEGCEHEYDCIGVTEDPRNKQREWAREWLQEECE